MNHENLKTREDTRFVLVHFTGEDSPTYEQIKQSHLLEGEPEIGVPRHLNVGHMS